VVAKVGKRPKTPREIELEKRVSELEDERDQLRGALEPPPGPAPAAPAAPAPRRGVYDEVHDAIFGEGE
jgi:hypothetical protein